jgi:CheY-like chemotaxis protein
MSRVALVVDDSMLIRHTVCRYLEERGFIVESSTNGLDALEVLKTVIPDIIVTDMQMPKMEGAELITKLKANPQTQVIPVIVLAGRATTGNQPDSRADAVIFKDIEIEAQLSRALGTILGERAAKI